ncbi:MAG: nitroreductase family protein [Bacillota bacterium]
MELILERRSIRNYTSDPVPRHIIKNLLHAAMAAPSAGNEQPWHFIVLDEREVLDKLAKLHPDAGMLTDAPAAVLVCGDLGLEEYDGYWVQDCSAATENILIAAEMEGLGSVWVGVHPNQEQENGIRDLFDLPGEIIPFAIVALGKPAEEKPPANRYDETRVHYNNWQ